MSKGPNTNGIVDEMVPVKDHSKLLMTFDGGSYPKNPGKVSCSGFAIYDGDDDELLVKGFHWVETENATNNYAEYCGAGFGLKFLAESGWNGKDLTIQGDSNLVIKQLSGEWRIKDARLKKLAGRVFDRINELDLAPHDEPETLIEDTRIPKGIWRAVWVPREENSVADALSRDAWQLYNNNY